MDSGGRWGHATIQWAQPPLPPPRTVTPGAYAISPYRSMVQRGRGVTHVDDETRSSDDSNSDTTETGDNNADGGSRRRPGPTEEEARHHLVNATLVDEEAERIIEARPALEGFRAIVSNKRFKYLVLLVVLLFTAIVVPVTMLVRSTSTRETSFAEEAGDIPCGTVMQNQSDYRGTIALTDTGKVCQRWDSQHPHNHTYTPQLYPLAGLNDNYCRNPSGAHRAWCFTADSTTEWEYCDVPFCAIPCGTAERKQSDYRGTISVTESGKTCQRWDSQNPNSHRFEGNIFPEAGLEGNYCRNPDGRARAWCIPEDPDSNFEWCDVPYCAMEEIPEDKQCGTLAQHQEDYRGSIATTSSGKSCQRWDSQEPHSHSRTAGNFPNAGLEENYCRNPDEEARAWCYTTDPATRWEYCDVPNCGAEGIFCTANCSHLTCGSGLIGQEDYRGTIAITENNRTCQRWDAQEPHGHLRTPQNYPSAGLEENYCRNPDNEARAWCYTTDPDKRWEYCQVPFCPEPPVNKTCGSRRYRQSDYRGAMNVTATGKTCQRWDAESPHVHSDTPSFRPGLGLEENYCRTVGAASRAWCYTTDPNTLRESCSVPFCDSETEAAKECGSLGVKLADYRGSINVTVSNRTCQRWDSQEPHPHKIPPALPGMDENYCRNPDGDERTWCYTTDPDVQWEFCDVPIC